MELGWLEDFLALVECGNFNRAAEFRNMTQPAFSRRIRALEDWMGAPLFDRSTHHGGLTEAGQTLRPLASEIVRRVQESREVVRQTVGTAASTLRIAATHALSQTFFPSWLRALEARGHVVGVHLTSDTRQGCEQAMRQGQMQFLLCHHHPAVPERLETSQFRSICVGHDKLLPVAAPDERGRPRFTLPGSPDAPQPLLFYSPESALGWIVKAAQAASGMTPYLETVFTAHLATVLLSMVRDGRGLAWLPRSLVDRDLAEGSLVAAGGAEWETEVEIRLFRSRARQAPAAEKFWSNLDDAADSKTP